MRSRLVILDANVIIEAFGGNFWNSLVTQYEVYVTSIVLRNEVYYFEDANGKQVLINLEADVQKGTIREISATSQEVAALEDRVNPNFLDRIDDGEKEAISLLLTGRFDDFRFCTGDMRAIKALSSLGLGAHGVSLEELLVDIGQKKKLPNPSYSKKTFELKKAEGLQEQSAFLKLKS